MIPYSKPNITEEDVAAASRCLAAGKIEPDEECALLIRELAILWDVPADWILLVDSCTSALEIVCRHLRHQRAGKNFDSRLTAACPSWPSTYTFAIPVDSSVGPDIAVALWGMPPPRRPRAPLVVDAAQDVFRSDYPLAVRDGRLRAVCYSFGPLKELTGGRGGALLARWAPEYASWIDSGTIGRVLYRPEGRNAKFDEPGAAMVRSQLRRERADRIRRQQVLRHYSDVLENSCVAELATPPGMASGHLAVLKFREGLFRDRVAGALLERGVSTGIHYPMPLWAEKSLYPAAVEAAERTLTLPCWVMSESQLDQCCDALTWALRTVE